MRNDEKPWLLIEAGRETGPWTFAQLQERYSNRQIGGDTLCFPKTLFGASGWYPLRHYFPQFERDLPPGSLPEPMLNPADVQATNTASGKPIGAVLATIGAILILLAIARLNSLESQLIRGFGGSDGTLTVLFLAGIPLVLLGVWLLFRIPTQVAVVSSPETPDSAQTSAPKGPNEDVAQRLRQLKTLFDDGVISEDEFNDRRSQLVQKL